MMAGRLGIRFSAFALAMAAKCGELIQLDLDHLLTASHQMLEPDDALFRAINTFAVGSEELPHAGPDRAAHLAELGDALLTAVDFANVPVPPDAERVDIHG